MQYSGHFQLWAPPSIKLNLPLNVRSVGCHDVSQGWRDKVKRKWFMQLFWTVEGEAEFVTSEKKHRVKANEIFLYRPGDTHEITAISSKWLCWWITWDNPESERWVEAFHLKERVNLRTKCPRWLFQEAVEGLRENIPQGQRRAIQASHAILLQTTIQEADGPHCNPLAEQARALLDTHFREASMTMRSLSKSLNVHRTTLFRTFQQAFGVSPSVYLHNRRMEVALGLLHSSSLRIGEVADQAGFSDPNYFSRAVKIATGMTPREIQMAARP